MSRKFPSNISIGNDWDEILREEFQSLYFKELWWKVLGLYEKENILPAFENIFLALKLTLFSKTKVIILGQDPYPNKEDAMGLAFSVPKGRRLPKSLINIYKEMDSDLGIISNKRGDLSYLAKQGVLFLNSILTVKENASLSHKDLGWQNLTDKIINILSKNKRNLVFVLWGNFARSKKAFVENREAHFVLESAHPSPLSASRGFFGSKPFSKTNDYLREHSINPINWNSCEQDGNH